VPPCCANAAAESVRGAEHWNPPCMDRCVVHHSKLDALLPQWVKLRSRLLVR
jgi:hypothetical protein